MEERKAKVDEARRLKAEEEKKREEAAMEEKEREITRIRNLPEEGPAREDSGRGSEAHLQAVLLPTSLQLQ